MALTAQQKRERAARAKALLAGLEDSEPAVKSDEPTHRPAPKKESARKLPNNDDILRGYKAGFPRHETETVPPERWPKKYPNPTDLKAGDSVWYSGERYWIDWVPTHWSQSVFIRLCSQRIRPGSSAPKDSHYFYAPADCVDLAPTAANPYTKQPSMADVARKERAATGARDIGDPVAEMLRSAGSHEELYSIASEFLGVPVDELMGKYGHLNPGQQRMNLGNRMRAKWKKENKK